MKRATFTVKVKNKGGAGGSCAYDAHVLIANFDETVSFVSSGTTHTVHADDVESIEYGRAGWCGQCDQSIEQYSRIPNTNIALSVEDQVARAGLESLLGVKDK